MRGKKAKRLRRLAQLRTTGLPEVKYEVAAKGRAIDTGKIHKNGDPIIRYNPDSMKLSPRCTRSYYHRLKAMNP